MDDASTAGQFNIIDGQLVYNTGSSAPLYMWVEDPVDKTQRALATWFNSTASTYGNFSFSGDTVTWTDPDVARPNTAAFYVCPGNGTDATEKNALYVNTGAYLYDTPSGCYDIDVSWAFLFSLLLDPCDQWEPYTDWTDRFITTEVPQLLYEVEVSISIILVGSAQASKPTPGINTCSFFS